MRLLGLWVLLLALLGVPAKATAHPIDSASLTLTETSPGTFRVAFQSGSNALNRTFKSEGQFPEHCRLDAARLECGAQGLVGTLRFPWLEGTLFRLLVTIEWRDGSRTLKVVIPSAHEFPIYPPKAGLSGGLPVLRDYTVLGVEHILEGFDHLCFVAALSLLVRRRSLLVATVSAFTIAHSITLIATALEWVRVAPGPVEALIALSIVFAAAECLSAKPSWFQQAPWLVAALFGLLHGFGFASALLGVGLPEEHIPVALLSFNLGVECGQLFVILIFLSVLWAIERSAKRAPQVRTALAYAIGTVGAYWAVERVFGLWGA